MSWLHPFKEQKLVVVADSHMVVFDDTKTDGKLLIYPHRIDWIDRAPVAHRAEAQVVPISDEEPLRLECQHFLECVSERKTPRTSGEKGVRVLRILKACEQSVDQQGRPLVLAAPSPQYSVHPTAAVDQPCEIGPGTRIWHFSHVMVGAKIGERCTLGQNVCVSPDVKIGNNVKIQNNVSVYTGVELEDEVFCGPSMVFTNVINPRSHIARKHEFRRTLVKRGASLGANSTIICGTTIGQFAFVAAGAVVTRDVPDFALIMGIPGKQVGWVCQCGVRLPNDVTAMSCKACGCSYELEGHRLHQRIPSTK